MLPRMRPCPRCHYPIHVPIRATGTPVDEHTCPNGLCPKRPVCPRCGSARVHRPLSGGVVECVNCQRMFHAVEQSLSDPSPARLRELLDRALSDS